MVEYEYLHESGKNYLKTGEASKGDYITEMLIHNNIPGFVGAQLKSRNAESFIVYPVSGLISIKQVLEMRKLTGVEAEGLILSFVKACHGMADYLLPLHRLNLNPEFIYENYGKNTEFLWIYGNEEAETGSLGELFQYFLDRTDYKDEKAVRLMYGLYQTCKGLEAFGEKEKDEGLISLVSEKAEELLKNEKNAFDLGAKAAVAEENRVLLQWEAETMGEAFPMELSAERETGKKAKLSDPGKRKKGKKKEKKTSEKREKTEGNGGKLKFALLTAWEYLKSDVGSKKEKEVVVVEEQGEDYKLRDVKVVKREERAKAKEEKRTTLLTNGMVHQGLYCLKPEESGESRILITSYPFFIGTAEKEVNFSIDDSTVSRYHARIDRTEDDFFLTDLGSTNGTFLNGMRMIPYERMRLSGGDTVVISRKRYEFRYMD